MVHLWQIKSGCDAWLSIQRMNSAIVDHPRHKKSPALLPSININLIASYIVGRRVTPKSEAMMSRRFPVYRDNCSARQFVKSLTTRPVDLASSATHDWCPAVSERIRHARRVRRMNNKWCDPYSVGGVATPDFLGAKSGWSVCLHNLTGWHNLIRCTVQNVEKNFH